jgi:type II secretory pathway component PulK
MHCYRKNNIRSGLVLIAVMWIMIVLTVIVAVVAQASRIDTRTSLSAAERIRCKWALRAGMETAIAVLNDDKNYNYTDTFDDLWYYDPEDFNNFDLGSCSYSTEVIDECGKLNINTVTKKQLTSLPGMTEEIANSILDWRDKDDKIRPGSAEAGYYINLPYPYYIRNAPFRTIRELLLVKDVTDDLFYGSDGENAVLDQGHYNEGWINYLTCYSYMRNRDVNGDRLVNINRGSESRLARELEIPNSYAKWIVANRKGGFKKLSDLISKNSPKEPKESAAKSEKAEPLDIKTVLQIADKITLNNNNVIYGKVNINTADIIVIYAIVEGNETIAESIVAHREGTEGGFSSLADLANIGSISTDNIKKLLDNVTTRSNIFMLKVTANAYQTATENSIEAVVDRYESPAKLLFYCSGVNN